ncbi:MAG: DNA (cytosine-5-)-methyltransferase [Oscillospiraceae bacterium]|nr:DNA (cytosine-5-)-methyltransferase [Oscillospiraceae bacterium]
MNEMITVQAAAKKWNITPRRVQILCNEGRIDGAVKKSGIWFIPSTTAKPARQGKQTKSHTRKTNINVLSLFSGCGGMDLGFEGDFEVLKLCVNKTINKHWNVQKIDENWVRLPKNRFHTVFANDIKEDAKAAWTNYFGKKGISASTYYLDSIVDLVKLHQENGISVFPQNIDIVTGGFPCQDFSIAGKRQGFDSDKSHTGKRITDSDTPSIESRGQLYMWMREVIAITQPKMFIAENVKGLANLGDVKAIIEHDFSTISENGYLVVPARVLHAADYGVPQSRERVIFFGFKKSALTMEALKALSLAQIPEDYDPYPIVTHAYNNPGNMLLPPVTVRQAFCDLDEPENSADVSQQKYSKAKYMGKHCQGQTEIKLDSIGPTIRSEHHGNIEFRRLSIEHGGHYVEELKSGKRERRLTIRECARIQTFPDSYDFVFRNSQSNTSVSASEAYKLIGNAVPPLLGFHIAKRIETLWEIYFGGDTGDRI